MSTGEQSSDGEDYDSNLRVTIPVKPKTVIRQKPCSIFSSVRLPLKMNHHNDDEKEKAKKIKREGSSPVADGVDGEFKDKLEAICRGLENSYSAYNEELPNLPAYHPSFANVEDICEDLFAGAAQIFEISDYQDGYTESLHAKIKQHRSITYPPAMKIGFMGDSGVGKSSLINSILNTPGLAAQGDYGSACTCVITEYRQASQTQVQDFHAEIELFNMKEIRKMMREHLEAYYEYHFNRQDEVSEDELETAELDAGTALKVFQALFADQEEFRGQDRAQNFLRTATSSSDSAILSKFVVWIENLISLIGGEDGIVHRSSDATEDLTFKLETFVGTNSILENENGETLEALPSLWPIVKIVRVGLQSHFLSQGLVIADLPGLSDTNTARVKTTKQYIKECAYCILVAPIGRVITDDIVHHRLMEAFRRPGVRKMLVTTKIDDLSHHTKPQKIAVTPQSIEEFSRLSHAQSLVARELKGLESSVRKPKGEARKGIEQKRAILAFRKKQYDMLKQDALVRMRNHKVTLELRRKYQGVMPEAPNLQINCVSNLHYEHHVIGYNRDFLPLPIETTGIPALRTELLALSAPGKLSVLQHHWKRSLVGTIASMKNYSRQTVNQRQEELEVVVQKSYETYAEEIAVYVNSLGDLVEDDILQQIGQCENDWKAHGLQLTQDWAKMHHSTFGAWCRRNGAHASKKQKYLNWNYELLEPVVGDVSRIWKPFKENVERAKERCCLALQAMLDNVRNNLQAEDGVILLPMDPFLESLTPKKEELLEVLNRFSDKVEALSRTVKYRMMLDDDDSFMMEAMLPLYAKMKRAQGRGLHLQRVTLLEDTMQRGEPFGGFVPGIRAAMKHGVEDLQPQLLKGVKSVFEGVSHNFDLMFVVKELPNERRDALRQRIKRYVDHANSRINGELTLEFAMATMGRY